MPVPFPVYRIHTVRGGRVCLCLSEYFFRVCLFVFVSTPVWVSVSEIFVLFSSVYCITRQSINHFLTIYHSGPGIKSNLYVFLSSSSCRPRRPIYLAPTTASPIASPSCCGGASCRTTAPSCSASSTRPSGRSSGTTTTAATTASSATPRRECRGRKARPDHPDPKIQPASSSTSRGRLEEGPGVDTGRTRPVSTALGPLPLLMTLGPPRSSKVNTHIHAFIHSYIHLNVQAIDRIFF